MRTCPERHDRFAYFFLAAATLTACGDGGARDAGFAVDTLDGVITATNHGGGVWGADAGWRLRTPVRIGDDPLAEDPYAFGSITGLTVAPGGRIFVADGQAREVRAFSPDGTFLFRFGRSGEGPGEFGALDALARDPEGRIVARDPRLFRITRFTEEGAYVSDVRLQRPFLQFSNGLGLHITEDGTIYDRVTVSLGVESADSLALATYAATGEPLDLIVTTVSPRRTAEVTVDGVPYMGMPIPFSPQASVTVGPDGVIARALGEAYSFDLLQRSGAVVRTIRRDLPPVPITTWERDSSLTVMRERVVELTDNGQLEDFEFPSVKAAITLLMADAAGNWWVSADPAPHAPADTMLFDVFERDGRFLGQVAVPFRPIEIGADYIAGVATDELDVQSIVVAPLIKDDAAAVS